ncbi:MULTISPECIES: nucleoside-diphosphate sugar epimerase/dehydratase [unclassified Sphingobacterium]|uniref:nucleoside-diphosphate sugar epimerase/dehydratase n=1 Tax=unclassified Sphingobacterium TaxID=2609468 RepID=UPI00104A965C|nr:MULTISPECIES: nucleoside-diphosphate sugar epimerase/dehydratase [unclassified Sphingobacterium]MCS3553458.1 FlaA1/EpsC-like NDP-sugar epimerase [Sphingobacterium sp. JUb21]TCR09332.1 FlaA1/EpsC-like NDP-sugar epimerase [Sphingobacterium sp. JUb20]
MISFFGDLKRHLYRDHPRWIILMIDMFIVFVSYVLSIYVLYDLKGFADVSMMLKKLIIILFVYFTFFVSNSTFKGIVRQTGIQDAIKIFKTTATAYIVLMLFMIIIRSVVERGSVVSDYLRLPYGLLTMQFCMLLVFMIGSRVVYRTVFEYLSLSARKLENVLIFGASRPGLSTYSLLKEDPQVKYHVIAFVEDQLNRVGKRLAGLKILDITEITSDFIKRNRITDVIIAVENNDPERLQYVSDWFHQLGLELKIMSPARILPNSRVNREIRPLEIDDLLGRKPIKLDHQEIEAEMEGKVILVTGAAGSIGSELARQIARRSYKKLILLDQAESPLYDIQQSIKCSYPEHLHCVVGDVRNYFFMQKIFAEYHPDLVFHAAAYKHVPLMEANPYESIQTNVLGSKNVVDLSMKYGVKKMVMVSTDKAVNPTNIMGATKRMAEIYVSSCSGKSDTQFIITRFGNVLGSNGSVIPLFEKQMEQGGPLTLTHPDITRFFMTIPEACQLVQEAGVMGKGGEIFVFDMGKSIRIIDLAKRMINLKGYRYPEDIDIKIVGLRPGEKIYEELLANNENTIKTHHPKIMIAKVNHDDLPQKVERINYLCQHIVGPHAILPDFMNLVRHMKKIVPEFKSQNSEFEILDNEVLDMEIMDKIVSEVPIYPIARNA